MTNQYALGYKAGLDAAVKVCNEGHNFYTAHRINSLPVPQTI